MKQSQHKRLVSYACDCICVSLYQYNNEELQSSYRKVSFLFSQKKR